MKAPVFRGSSVAIVTPFTKEGKVNYAKFHELVDKQIAGGTAAITVCGTTGESATLQDDEHVALIKDCIDYVASFKGQSVMVLKSSVIDEPAASDHRPLVVNVGLTF